MDTEQVADGGDEQAADERPDATRWAAPYVPMGGAGDPARSGATSTSVEAVRDALRREESAARERGHQISSEP